MPQATPFDDILAQARDLFSERLSAAMAVMLDKADEALTVLESETRDTEAQALYRETRDNALSQREKIETQFRVRYLREFQIRSNRARKIGTISPTSTWMTSSWRWSVKTISKRRSSSTPWRRVFASIARRS